MLWWGIEEAAGTTVTVIVDFGSGILLFVISASMKMIFKAVL